MKKLLYIATLVSSMGSQQVHAVSSVSPAELQSLAEHPKYFLNITERPPYWFGVAAIHDKGYDVEEVRAYLIKEIVHQDNPEIVFNRAMGRRDSNGVVEWKFPTAPRTIKNPDFYQFIKNVFDDKKTYHPPLDPYAENPIRFSAPEGIDFQVDPLSCERWTDNLYNHIMRFYAESTPVVPDAYYGKDGDLPLDYTPEPALIKTPAEPITEQQSPSTGLTPEEEHATPKEIADLPLVDYYVDAYDKAIQIEVDAIGANIQMMVITVSAKPEIVHLDDIKYKTAAILCFKDFSQLCLIDNNGNRVRCINIEQTFFDTIAPLVSTIFNLHRDQGMQHMSRTITSLEISAPDSAALTLHNIIVEKAQQKMRDHEFERAHIKKPTILENVKERIKTWFGYY
jgi:hypothetical protein